MEEKVEILERSTVFQGRFRIDRYRLRHRLHDGGWSAPLTREVFERGHAVGVLLYDPARDMVGLIEQFRVGALAAGRDPWLIEVVAGIIDDGEAPEEVARRETREEAGLEIDELVPMPHFLLTPGASSETLALYCARMDADKLGGLHGLAEEGEDIRVMAVPTAQALAWVETGRIANATAVIALQWLALHKEEVRARWR